MQMQVIVSACFSLYTYENIKSSALQQYHNPTRVFYFQPQNNPFTLQRLHFTKHSYAFRLENSSLQSRSLVQLRRPKACRCDRREAHADALNRRNALEQHRP